MSSTIYLTKINSGPAIPSFSQKNIANQMPGVVGEVPINITATFFSLSRNLFKFIFRTFQTMATVATNVPLVFNLFKPTKLAATFEVPVCTFRFKNLTPSEVIELKGMGMQQDLTNANLFVGAPSSYHLSRIHTIGPIEDRIRPGHLSYDSFFAWVYLMKGLQIFSTAKNNMAENQCFSLVAVEEYCLAKGSTGKINSIDGKKVDHVNATGGVIAPFLGQLLFGEPSADHSSFPGSYHDVASTSQKTFGKGLFFPFFSGMNTPDKTTSFDTFHSLFQNTLADTEDNSMDLMNRVRKGCRQLSFSRSGMVLAHIYRCIGIAADIEGAKITYVLKGSAYVGTIIEGTMSLRMYGTDYQSGDVDEALKRVNLLDSQASEICDKLNALVDENQSQVYHFVKTDFLSSRSALRSFNTVDPDLFHSSDTIAEVRSILEEMEFNDSFGMPSQEMVLDAVTFMSTGVYAGIAKYPAYLGGGVLYSGSRTYEALSMFGPKAPSCNTGDSKGTIITFPGEGKEDTNLVRVNGVRPLHYFPMWLVPVGVAASQWDKMINQGRVIFPPARKNKKEFTDLHRVALTVASDPQFGSMYDMVKVMANDARKTGTSGGKRKRETDDGPGKDKKQKVDNAASDI